MSTVLETRDPRLALSLLYLLWGSSVITPSTGLAVGLAAALLAVDALGWRAVAATFDREWLITAART